MSGSRGKQRHHEEEHEEHVNHEAWVIPYADVLTLLMALFLVLFALGDPNKEKLEIAAQSFRNELGGGSSPFDLGIGSGGAGPLADGGASVLDGAGPAPMAADLPPEQAAPPTTVGDEIGPPDVVVVPVVGDTESLPAACGWHGATPDRHRRRDAGRPARRGRARGARARRGDRAGQLDRIPARVARASSSRS